jgi:hypothetical protein
MYRHHAVRPEFHFYKHIDSVPNRRAWLLGLLSICKFTLVLYMWQVAIMFAFTSPPTKEGFQNGEFLFVALFLFGSSIVKDASLDQSNTKLRNSF